MPTTWYPFRFDNSTRCKGTSQSDGRTFVRRLRTRQEINFCASIQLKDTGGYWRWIFRIILRMFEDGWAMLSLYIELMKKPETWGIFFEGQIDRGPWTGAEKLKSKLPNEPVACGSGPKIGDNSTRKVWKTLGRPVHPPSMNVSATLFWFTKGLLFIRVASSFLPHCLWRLVSRGFIPKNEVWIWQLIRTTLSSVCSRACAHVYALQEPSVCLYVYGYVS